MARERWRSRWIIWRSVWHEEVGRCASVAGKRTVLLLPNVVVAVATRVMHAEPLAVVRSKRPRAIICATSKATVCAIGTLVAEVVLRTLAAVVAEAVLRRQQQGDAIGQMTIRGDGIDGRRVFDG